MYEKAAAFLNMNLDDDMYSRLSVDARAFFDTQEGCLGALSLEGKMKEDGDVDPRDLCRQALAWLGLRMNGSMFFRMGHDDNFEIWSSENKLLAAGSNTLRRLSYSADEIFKTDWQELFERDPKYSEIIRKAWVAVSRDREIIDDVCPHHRVVEIGGGKREAWVAVKSICLVYREATGQPCAILAVTNIKDHAPA